MSELIQKPDLLFEVGWEVCNKIGGIHTVISTKALTVTKKYGDNYIVIGPDLATEEEASEFQEDATLLKAWRQMLYEEGIRVRVGRWKIEGNPLVVLVDFTSLFAKKDEILKQLWDEYGVDSLSGQWDYVEPVLFGYAAGLVISSYTANFSSGTDKVVAHFHEWMTASGGLYLRKNTPYIATVFTTHATVIGRCIAGNGLPLYNGLTSFNADDLARQFNVMAKHSIEKSAATKADAFLTVSDITANECGFLLNKSVDCVTPNGFEDDFVWQGELFETKRKEARKSMIGVAEAMLDYKFESEPLIVGVSGRYEYTNKGLDVFIESLKKLATSDDLDREILAYITVPAGNVGARKDLKAHMKDSSLPLDSSACRYTTHNLEHLASDPVMGAISGTILESANSKVKVVFVPSYLNGSDGIFNKTYYELLVGMDVTVFASYYEPWGYTPLESVAFSVPTITTTLAGFGMWVNGLKEHAGVEVIHRDDYNRNEVAEKISDSLIRFASLTPSRIAATRRSAHEIAQTALWENLFSHYESSYSIALDKSANRINDEFTDRESSYGELANITSQQLFVERPVWHRVMIEKTLPARLRMLDTIAHNLWWSWTGDAREIFESLDEKLWVECDRNPIAILDKLSVERMSELEHDAEFLDRLDQLSEKFTNYMEEKPDPASAKISYFSMEFGLHSSLKIYSGGLGILAGDYLKEASDKNVPMSAVGLLYRYGYFTQKLSAQGSQEATYEAQNFLKLPISPVRDADENWITVSIALPGRSLWARVWKCQVGRTDLFLLDTDYEANHEEDRRITHHLYGGDWENRLKQEMLLGIGGVRALNAMGVKNQVYHCNEGHAAFIGVERIREYIKNDKLSFSEALEVVRSSALFTTHTPVPAGHDAFPESMVRQYMSHYPDVLGITWEQYINLGKVNYNDPNERFSMSVLACNLSQEVNGVSWLHGEVSKDIMGNMWPGYFKNELHIGYVTNGVHFPTWISSRLHKLYMKYFPKGFSDHVYDIPEWQNAHKIGNDELWSSRMYLKTKLINHICKRYRDMDQVRLETPRHMVQIAETLKPEVLTIGFARRFATYKRAHLLFTNLERLSAIVNNKERPVQFIFAGKAHPNDRPGQDLIKRIVEVSAMPQFVGKIIFLQNYDMELARRMVQGVDVWLNTPTRPLEASGTSGEKCVMNGVLQFSVLDGWWVEGYKENAGWMLPMERTFTNQDHQNELDAELIYNTIEDQIVPKYYDRDENGMPCEWLKAVKNCIADIASNFTMNRMLIDYEDRFYNKLKSRSADVVANNFAMARELAAWKRRVSSAWEGVKVVDVKRVSLTNEPMYVDSKYCFEVTVDINRLRAEDIGVEIVVAKPIVGGDSINVEATYKMNQIAVKGNLVSYKLDFNPMQTGVFDIAMRIFPQNDKLAHRMDFALVKWA